MLATELLQARRVLEAAALLLALQAASVFAQSPKSPVTDADVARAARNQPVITDKEIDAARRKHRMPTDEELARVPVPLRRASTPCRSRRPRERSTLAPSPAASMQWAPQTLPRLACPWAQHSWCS